MCRADCMKEDRSHDELLFVCLCPQRTSERGYIGTDESRFNIQNDSRRSMIWREPGTCSREPNIVERGNYRGGGLLVWAGISTERPNRPLRVRWGFRHSCPISRRNPTPSCEAFYRCNGYRRDIYER
ncbi:hypothetical protein AVEN_117387-1 [Araneus ventricosus]|uniref:Uncharacterized protein n=1 Tax=Araneus ventricosus TaxID=182803 RepID=A0A4Y2E4L4_ARAVE|nr:hypothetical protein AVEN_117387-1 [Araneus ventricosus]